MARTSNSSSSTGFIGAGQFEPLKRGEFVVNKIFDGDSVTYKEINSWIRANPFRSKKVKGYNGKYVNVCTYKELYDKIQYMWTLLPREGTKRYKLLLQMEEYYNKHKPRNLERI